MAKDVRNKCPRIGKMAENTFKNASYLIDAPDIEELRGAFSFYSDAESGLQAALKEA